MRIRVARQARADMIWVHVARVSGSEGPANRVIESITNKFALLARFPLIGKSPGIDTHPHVRAFAAQQHMIFYRLLSGEIRILRVIHGSRDALAVFAQE